MSPLTRKKQTTKPNNWADYAYFRDVAKHQKRLTITEEEDLFKDYTELEKEFKRTLLSNPTAQTNLIKLVQQVKDNNRSIAKLHCRFDNNKEGHNKSIIEEMNLKFENILLGNSNVARKLYDVGFSKDVFNKVYIESLPSLSPPEKEKISKIKDKIKDIESKLTCSALMMAVSIAQKYTSNISSIDIKDAIQEATIGIYESVNLYDPDYRSKNGNKIKFSTYANIKAEKRVKEKIMQTSRLIRLPKSRLEVLFIVLRASAGEEELNIETITKKSNHILEKRKKRKLKPNEILSEERIIEAINLLNNNCIMLDSPIDGQSDASGEIKTFSDVIPDPQLTVEEETLLKDSKKELTELIKTYLDKVLWHIVVLRYISDPPKSHEGTAKYLYENNITNTLFTKETIRQKETYALKKLAVKDNKNILRNLLKESITARSQMGDR